MIDVAIIELILKYTYFINIVILDKTTNKRISVSIVILFAAIVYIFKLFHSRENKEIIIFFFSMNTCHDYLHIDLAFVELTHET